MTFWRNDVILNRSAEPAARSEPANGNQIAVKIRDGSCKV